MNTDETSVTEHLLAIRTQLAALCEQQKSLCDLLARFLKDPDAARKPLQSAAPPPAAPTHEVLAQCAGDILRILRDAYQPLTALEILDELVRHQLRWRESTVRHALTNLLEEGVIADRQDIRPHSYGLAATP